ncbi:MAG: universal stress protein [Hyphomonadaceae bacterium]
MDRKNIVVFADGADAGLTRVQMAVELGRETGAHVDVRFLYRVPELPVGVELPALDGVFDRLVEQEHARAQDTVRKLAAIGSPGPSFSIHAQSTEQGPLGRLAALAMQGVDLGVLALPEGDAEQAEILHSALFASGAPCLALPKWNTPHRWGERILVAWKATSEAGRALSAALPFLAKAKAVRLLVVNPRGAHVGEDNEGLERLASRLLRHGVDVEAPLLITAEAEEIGRAIADEGEGFGADLVVMGAYGHSRFTEWVLGGVTRHMLQHGAVPLLLTH